MTAAKPAAAREPPPLALLVHGLARTTRMFNRMAPALDAAGFAPERYAYPSRRYRAAASAAMFRGYLEYVAARDGPDRTVHLVGFSLGALLIRAALARPVPSLAVGRVVMIGPPNKGVGILDDRIDGLARRIFGPAIDDMTKESPWIKTLGTPDVPVGVIAGNRPFPPIGPAAHLHLWRGTAKDVPNDGTVEVENTRLDGMADFTVVPANHTFLCTNAVTIRHTVHFLGHGRFEAKP